MYSQLVTNLRGQEVSEPIKVQAARNAQAKADKDDTAHRLLKKKRKSLTRKIVVDDETIDLVFEAVSSRELDRLRAKHPPTAEQRVNGQGVNTETFAPALVAATLVSPELSEEEIVAMWEDDSWSTGELGELFDAASTVCLSGFDIPPSANA